jgi:hypothetical protein
MNPPAFLCRVGGTPSGRRSERERAEGAPPVRCPPEGGTDRTISEWGGAVPATAEKARRVPCAAPFSGSRRSARSTRLSASATLGFPLELWITSPAVTSHENAVAVRSESADTGCQFGYSQGRHRRLHGEPGRAGERRHAGTASGEAGAWLRALRRRLGSGHRSGVVSQARPCGYVLYRAQVVPGIARELVAPSSLPRRLRRLALVMAVEITFSQAYDAVEVPALCTHDDLA